MSEEIFVARDAFLSVPQVPSFSTTTAHEELILLDEGTTYKNIPSRLVHSDETLSDLSSGLLSRTVWTADPTYVVRIPHGRLINGTLPVTRENVLFHDLSTHAGRHIRPCFVKEGLGGTLEAHVRPGPLKRLDKSAALLFFSSASGNNHSHWLLQTVPKVKMFQRAGVSPDYFAVLPSIRPYQRETLHALGILDEQILVLDPSETVEFRSLYVSYTGNDIHPDLSLYEEIATSIRIPPETPELIYVSRMDARNMRRFLNEDAVIDTAKRLGFAIVTMSSLSFEDEVRLFRNARIIAGPLGAGLYNALFTRAGATIIALSDPAYVMDWPMQMASLKGHEIIHLLGNSFLSYEEVHRGTHNSWVLDPARFEETIEGLPFRAK